LSKRRYNFKRVDKIVTKFDPRTFSVRMEKNN